MTKDRVIWIFKQHIIMMEYIDEFGCKEIYF